MTKTDIENIKEQFKEVIKYSQGVPNPKVDELFDEWREAKRDFIEAMGGKLIYEYPTPVCFDLNKDDKMKRIEDFENLVGGRYENYELANFIVTQRDGFFTNRVVKEYEAPDGTKISVGMKLLKAFKFFEEDKNVLDMLQTSASMIIQEDKIEGILCLSVHPLDYLSVSENTHNWRSCHALDGEYRGGNLSYMKDKTTVICYLRSKNMEKLNNFPDSVKWNSKKWRVLLYFSENWGMLFAGRQYPFSSDTGINFVTQKLLPVSNFGTYSDWTTKKLTEFNNGIANFKFNYPLIPYGNTTTELAPINKIVTNEPGSLQFNDLLSSSCYNPMYCYKTVLVDDSWLYRAFGDPALLNEEADKKATDEYSHYEIVNMRYIPTVKVGGKVKCLCCGEKYIELTESMMCNECEGEYGEADSDLFGTCPICGCRFIYEDGAYVEGEDEVICPSCAEDSTTYCANCGCLFYNEYVRYDRKTESYYCEDCFVDCNCELEEEID